MLKTNRGVGSLVAAILLTAFAATDVAHAQAKAGDKGSDDSVVEGGVAYKRKTVFNFDDDTIEGDLKVPDAMYLDVKKKQRHNSLIQIRREFRREILGSISDL